MLQIFDQRMRIRGGEHVSFDDSGVEDAVGDISCDQAELPKRDHPSQLLVHPEFLQ